MLFFYESSKTAPSLKAGQHNLPVLSRLCLCSDFQSLAWLLFLFTVVILVLLTKFKSQKPKEPKELIVEEVKVQKGRDIVA